MSDSEQQQHEQKSDLALHILNLTFEVKVIIKMTSLESRQSLKVSLKGVIKGRKSMCVSGENKCRVYGGLTQHCG